MFEMKLLLLFSFIAVTISLGEISDEWHTFKLQHSKSYKTIIEEQNRRLIFQQNLQLIKQHNAQYDQGLSSYQLGVTQFADLTSEEFAKMFNKQVNNVGKFRSSKMISNGLTPDSVDWRKDGAVTPVQDMGACGGSSAFSAVGGVEGQYFIKHGKLVPFSVQQIADCSSDFSGCTSGTRLDVYKYIEEYGLESASDYGNPTECNYDPSKVLAKSPGHVDLPANNETSLEVAVATVGPISVGVNANPFQFYVAGVYDGDCELEINHDVLAVGYGTENGVDYWVLKNSWGTAWGENGYFRLKRGENLCCVACYSSYPLVD